MDVMRFSSLGPRLRRLFRDGVECVEVRPRRNWKVIGAAALALLFGSFKGELALHHGFDGSIWSWDLGQVLLLGAWLVWLVAFASEFFGTETYRIDRGELVISRGIGPLRRTFRYPVRGITILDVDGPVVDEGAPLRVHHIYLRPKLGTVRFDYGGKTRYFAETLDMDEAAKIVDWLALRLPRSASKLQAIGGTHELRL